MFYSNSINSAYITVPTCNGLYLVLELPEIDHIVIIRPHYLTTTLRSRNLYEVIMTVSYHLLEIETELPRQRTHSKAN